ncbi:MAG: hypothetical protein FRX49_12659 [Trebouxia sp. A1-2]|nr:MAG: hypothetical protein FRX49_12659 [Trebouxia sp. A1-2]
MTLVVCWAQQILEIRQQTWLTLGEAARAGSGHEITCMRHLRMPRGLPAGKGFWGSFSPSTLWLLYRPLSMLGAMPPLTSMLSTPPSLFRTTISFSSTTMETGSEGTTMGATAPTAAGAASTFITSPWSMLQYIQNVTRKYKRLKAVYASGSSAQMNGQAKGRPAARIVTCPGLAPSVGLPVENAVGAWDM